MVVIWCFMYIFYYILTSALSQSISHVLTKFIIDVTTVLYPPAAITIHSCMDQENTFRLSTAMSKNFLIHNIWNNYESLDSKYYNNLEHKNLYVLDLDCKNVIRILQTVNESNVFVAPTKWLMIQKHQSNSDAISCLNQTNFNSNNHDFIANTLKDLRIYPDSDVNIMQKCDEEMYQVFSIYRTHLFQNMILENRGNWTTKHGITTIDNHPASRRRQNLHQTQLKSCLVLTNPDTMNHLTDYHDKHIDAVTKANYPWVQHLVNRLNATVTFVTKNSWGYASPNGSWSGMIGMLQRREIDFGGTGTFLVAERLAVVEYIQLYTRTGSRFIFRQPLLSSVKNIFTLPFHRNVWIAIGIFLIAVYSILCLSSKWDYRRNVSSSTLPNSTPGYAVAEPTIIDNFLVILGAMSQQGFTYEPMRTASRIVVLMLLVVALSLYAAYSANIVALLQSTTDSIKTLKDLYDSPLKLGIQDVVYNRHYTKNFADPIREAIMRDKIEPKGRKSSWMTLEEGIRRLRHELFAFHVEFGTAYQMIQETFQEEEKCGLTEIDYLNVLYPLLVIQKQSPYRELLKVGALKISESGLKYREESRLWRTKPSCHGHTSSITIGLMECEFAFLCMGYGILVACFVFACEIFWNMSWEFYIKNQPRASSSTRFLD